MVEKSKLIHIIPSLGSGGAETFLGLLALNQQRSEGLDLKILTFIKGGLIQKSIIKNGLSVITFELKTIKILLNVFNIYQFIKSEKFQIVQTWMYHANLIGGILARLAGTKKIIWTVCNSGSEINKFKISTKFFIYLNALFSYLIPSKIVFCSEEALINHVKLGFCSKKMCVIPNGFDIYKFCPSDEKRNVIRTELNIDHNKIVVGMVARFDPQKNYRMFATVMGLINKQFPDVHFVLVGKGIDHQNKSLKSWLQDCSRENFNLIGEREDIQSVMCSFDILVSSSNAEAFGNVIAEGMLTGLPCVVTDVGVCKDIVGDTGFSVKANNTASMTLALEKLITMTHHDRKTLGQNARERIKKKYNISIISKKYTKLYGDNYV